MYLNGYLIKLKEDIMDYLQEIKNYASNANCYSTKLNSLVDKLETVKTEISKISSSDSIGVGYNTFCQHTQLKSVDIEKDGIREFLIKICNEKIEKLYIEFKQANDNILSALINGLRDDEIS